MVSAEDYELAINCSSKINVPLQCSVCESAAPGDDTVSCPCELVEAHNGWVYTAGSRDSPRKQRFYFYKLVASLLHLIIRRPLPPCVNAALERNGYGVSGTGYQHI
jgi:hypothetical protein